MIRRWTANRDDEMSLLAKKMNLSLLRSVEHRIKEELRTMDEEFALKLILALWLIQTFRDTLLALNMALKLADRIKLSLLFLFFSLGFLFLNSSFPTHHNPLSICFLCIVTSVMQSRPWRKEHNHLSSCSPRFSLTLFTFSKTHRPNNAALLAYQLYRFINKEAQMKQQVS